MLSSWSKTTRMLFSHPAAKPGVPDINAFVKFHLIDQIATLCELGVPKFQCPQSKCAHLISLLRFLNCNELWVPLSAAATTCTNNREVNRLHHLERFPRNVNYWHYALRSSLVKTRARVLACLRDASWHLPI